jgi:hypothetical protein
MAMAAKETITAALQLQASQRYQMKELQIAWRKRPARKQVLEGNFNSSFCRPTLLSF